MATAALKIPASVGAAIDFLFKVREERKAIEASAAKIKDQETQIEDAIFSKFKKTDLEGARGKAAQASIERPVVPTLSDPTAFYKHLAKTKEFDLLQQRLAVTAIRARWEDGKTVPGVTKFQKVRLHLTKVKVK